MAELEWLNVESGLWICYETDQRIQKRGNRFVLLPEKRWASSVTELQNVAEVVIAAKVRRLDNRGLELEIEITDKLLDEYELSRVGFAPGTGPASVRDYVLNWR